MGGVNEASIKALEAYIAEVSGASSAQIQSLEMLSGGAIQENWALDVEISGGPLAGDLAAVLRTNAPSGVDESLNRSQEFSILKAAFEAGVTVPEPLWLEKTGSVSGKPFFIMRRVKGVTLGHKLVKMVAADAYGGGRSHLAESLSRELALLHSLRPPRSDLDFLPPPPENPALAWVSRCRDHLDRLSSSYPALEWALRWLERNAPPPPSAGLVLCHNDFRIGNIMVDTTGVTGILDWEFAGWGDPLQDVGWFCAKCWRFGADEFEAGGIAARDHFVASYESAAGVQVDPEQVFYWEVAAHARWATIAAQQGFRFASGAQQDSLELALTAHIVPELEYEMLMMTEGRNA
jgi:aminoglycoside phosphotransferase (APT) family kinase protein